MADINNLLESIEREFSSLTNKEAEIMLGLLMIPEINSVLK